MSKIVDMNEKIAQTVTENYKKIENKFTEKFLEEDGSLKTGKTATAVTEGYKKIEDGVVGGFKKIEVGVVDGFNRVSDKFIDALFTKKNEIEANAKECAEKSAQGEGEEQDK